ncbi:MAG: oligosaccharide flippase family protein [bacterium]
MNTESHHKSAAPLGGFRSLIQIREKISQSPIGKRLIKGSFWSTLGLFFSKGLEILTFIFVARLLDKSKFGQLGIIQSTINLFKIFAWLWLGTTVTKFVSEFREKDIEKTGRIIGLSLLIACALGIAFALTLVITSDWLSSKILVAPEISTPLKISSLILFFGSLIGVQNGILGGLEDFKLIAIINLISGVLNLPLLILGVHYWGITGAIWALVILIVINWYFNQHYLIGILRKHGIKVTIRGAKQELPSIFHFSFPTFLSGILVNPINWVCNAMLANQPKGYSELGIFNAANQWRLAILFLPISLGTAILPILSSLKGTQQWQSYIKVTKTSILITAAASITIGLPIIIFAKQIMGFYGADYGAHSSVLIYLAVAAILTAIAAIMGNTIASLDKMWWGFLLNFSWGISLILFTKFMISKGALGLSVANFSSYLLHLLMVGLFIFYSTRKLKKR